MNIQSNFSIAQLFCSHKIRVFLADTNQYFDIKVPSVRMIYEDVSWGIFYNISVKGIDFLPNKQVENYTSLQLIKVILFNLGQYGNFRPLYDAILTVCNFMFDGKFIAKKNEIYIDNINITEEIWDYIVSILQLSYGEKTSLPPVFDSEEARAFWLAQKKQEDKIKKLRQQQQTADKEGIIKNFLSITYAFPSFTFDYLWDQTLAQIQWLQKYAAGAVSYEVNAQAYAAGNVKKGKKLDFFIK